MKIFSGKSVFMCFCFILVSGKELDITIEGDKIYKVGQELELKCLGNETMDATFKWIIEPDDDFKCVQEKGPKLTAKIPSICQVNITCLVEENGNSGSETIPLTIEEPCYKPDETTPTMETCSDGKKLDITIEGDKIYKVGQELELKCLGNETMDATFKWIIEPDDDFKCVQEKGPKLTAKIPSICQVNITCLVEENGNSGSETIPLTIEEPCYRNENEEPDETTPTMETCSDDTSSGSMVSATTILTTFAVVLFTLWKFYCRR